MTKRVSVYISDKHKHLIIAPRHQNDAGIIYEQEKCFSADLPINLVDLGTATINNLNLYSVKDKNLRDNKSTDWPAYKQSKVKSVKSLEQDYTNISIGSENESNLIIVVCGLPSNDSELTINSIISFYADKEKIGQRIMNVYNAYLTGKVF